MKMWVGYKGRLKSLLLVIDEILYAQYQIHVNDFDRIIRSNIHFIGQLKNKEDTVMVLIDFVDEEGLLSSQWFDIDKSLLRRYKTFTASMIDVFCSICKNTIKEKDIGCQTLFSV